MTIVRIKNIKAGPGVHLGSPGLVLFLFDRRSEMKIGERFNPYTHFFLDIYETVGYLIDVLGRERFLELLKPIIQEAENVEEKEERDEG